MSKNDYIIRLENENEHREVENLVRKAFSSRRIRQIISLQKEIGVSRSDFLSV